MALGNFGYKFSGIYIHITYEKMASWEPVDIDRDGTGDENYEWGDDLMNDLERRFNKLRQFTKTSNESRDETIINMTTSNKNALKETTTELVANQIYDKLTILLNNTRKKLGIERGIPIIDPVRNYDNFKLADDGEISYIYKNMVIDFGNINERPKALWEIRKFGVTKLKLMGFTNITDEDVQPCRKKYKKARNKLRKLDDSLNKRSKAIKSSSTTDAEAIELVELTSKEIGTTVNNVEQGMSFIETGDRDKLLPPRELEGLDKKLRTIRGSLKVAIAKRIDLEGRIEREERKLNEIQDPTYSDDQRNMIEDRMKKLRDELNERNKEINILKGEASKEINHIRESITKFLDKKLGHLVRE